MTATYTHIIPTLADTYAGHLNHSRKTVSLRAAKRGGFIDQLELGANITVKRGNMIIQWFADRWPEDLEWPADIPRPTPTERAA